MAGLLKPSLYNYNRQSRHWSRQGLISAWLFNEGGHYVHDYHGQNHGTWENSSGAGMGYSTGLNGRVFEHTGDGNDDGIELGSIPSTNKLSLAGKGAGGKATIVWSQFIPTGTLTNDFPRLLDKTSAGQGADGYAMLYDLGDNQMEFIHSGGSPAQEAGATVVRDVWEHYAFRIDGSLVDTAGASWFKDGVDIGAGKSGTPDASISSVTTNAEIAQWNHSTDRQWHGKIDYLYVFDRGLTDAEIIFLHMRDPFIGFRPAPRLNFAPEEAVGGGGRIMGSLAGPGGLAGGGGLAGQSGGLAA